MCRAFAGCCFSRLAPKHGSGGDRLLGFVACVPARHDAASATAKLARSCAGGADAASIEDVLRWGTAGEAKVLGLEPSGGPAPLKALLVGGRRVVEDDRLPGLDLAELGRQSREAVARLMTRAGA